MKRPASEFIVVMPRLACKTQKLSRTVVACVTVAASISENFRSVSCCFIRTIVIGTIRPESRATPSISGGSPPLPTPSVFTNTSDHGCIMHTRNATTANFHHLVCAPMPRPSSGNSIYQVANTPCVLTNGVFERNWSASDVLQDQKMRP